MLRIQLLELYQAFYCFYERWIDAMIRCLTIHYNEPVRLLDIWIRPCVHVLKMKMNSNSVYELVLCQNWVVVEQWQE